METKLKRISEISRKNPKEVFTSIGHLINKEMLEICHKEMDRNKIEEEIALSLNLSLPHS